MLESPSLGYASFLEMPSSPVVLSGAGHIALPFVSSASGAIKTYRVQAGDTLSVLSRRFGLNVATLLGANPALDSSAFLAVGSRLWIPPADGVVHTLRSGETLSDLTRRYKLDNEVIVLANPELLYGELPPGAMLFIPGVEPPRRAKPSSSSNYTLASLPGYFIIPTVGKNWGRLHGNNGVDIANVCGTPVVAAADGIVANVQNTGWNSGAGRFVLLQHPNGTQTFYGHLKELWVGVGATVGQGVAIGLIGNSGLTRGVTGCHLHFEVRGARNPLARS